MQILDLGQHGMLHILLIEGTMVPFYKLRSTLLKALPTKFVEQLVLEANAVQLRTFSILVGLLGHGVACAAWHMHLTLLGDASGVP